MCAPIAGHSESAFFIIQPNKQPRRKTLIESLITCAEKPFFDTQYGQCASINNNPEIRFAFQKLRLSFNRLRKKPLNSSSSEIGEKNIPTRMLNHSADLAVSMVQAFRWDISASPRTTRENQASATM